MQIRIFAPMLTHRIADPMPLPRRKSAKKVRLHVRGLALKKTSGKTSFAVKKIPVGK
ncbi:hypothetical protein KC725_01395 [Candidatus Peregrinibacteria bacterium]|nr:hypothetical protein [Candidatus Peregrinibacteria bacterium]